MEPSNVQYTGEGPGRCTVCGQFAADGHNCPLHLQLATAASVLYGADTDGEPPTHGGPAPQGTAEREGVEDMLIRMRLAADQMTTAGAVNHETKDAVAARLEDSWAALRAGGSMPAKDLARLQHQHDRHAAEVPPSARLAAAQQQLREAKVQLGMQALRQRRGRDPAALTEALARRDEALRELHRAQVVESHSSSSIDEGARCSLCGRFADAGHTCPLPPGLPAGNYSNAKGEARTQEMLADLQTAVEAVVASGQLQQWLDAMASNGLHRWSLNNRLLAVMQLAARGEGLGDVHMMGFRQWERLDRRVRKGEKAIWILAPTTRKVREEDEDGKTSERVLVTGFKAVPVFNVTQTDGQPLPEAPLRPTPGQATGGTLEGLRERVAGAGYAYSETVIPDCVPDTGRGTLGYTDPATKRIVVDTRLSPAQKASTIAHELGHVHCGHVDRDYSEYQRHRGRMGAGVEPRRPANRPCRDTAPPSSSIGRPS